LKPGGSDNKVIGYLRVFIPDVAYKGKTILLDEVIPNVATCART